MARDRDPKKPSTPPRTGQRTTARGFATAKVDDGDDTLLEPPHSSKPTRRDLSPPVERVEPPRADARGQFSVRSARRVAADAVAGTIDVSDAPKRRRGASLSGADVRVVSVNEQEITVVIRGDQLTLRRNDALALVKLINEAFGR